MSIKTMALGVVVAAAAYAAPAQAQVWNQRGDVVVRSDDRIVNRSARTVNGVRCVDVQLDRSGRRRTERLCDWNRDGVYGNEADRRYEERRRSGRRDDDSDYRYRNAGQRRAAEVHARNEARKREQAYEKRQRELLKERQKREQELLKERQKREREAQKRRQAGNGPVWQRG